MPKRKLDLVVISDVHLGTYGCHAKELNRYLKSIDPEVLVLNGDIIDIWQFSKYYWPESHMKVVKRLIKMLSRGTRIYYITGNHDEMLRKFVDFQMGNFYLVNKLSLDLGDKRTWIFHGDVFDVAMEHAKWLAKLGAIGYDILILINRFVNWISEKLGRGRISLSKQIKDGVKSAVKFINNFEKLVTEIAIENNYDYVVCGHIHQPMIKTYQQAEGQVVYLNSGDWIENLSSLEYHAGEWKLYKYLEDPEMLQENDVETEAEDSELTEDSDTSIIIENLYADIVRHPRDRKRPREQSQGNHPPS